MSLKPSINWLFAFIPVSIVFHSAPEVPPP